MPNNKRKNTNPQKFNSERAAKKRKTVQNRIDMMKSGQTVGQSSEYLEPLDTDLATKYFVQFDEKGILEIIFSEVESRRNISQVNKLFYSVACKVDNKQEVYRAYFNHTITSFKVN